MEELPMPEPASEASGTELPLTLGAEGRGSEGESLHPMTLPSVDMLQSSASSLPGLPPRAPASSTDLPLALGTEGRGSEDDSGPATEGANAELLQSSASSVSHLAPRSPAPFMPVSPEPSSCVSRAQSPDSPKGHPLRKLLRAHSLSANGGTPTGSAPQQLGSLSPQPGSMSAGIRGLEEKMLEQFEQLSGHLVKINHRLDVLLAGEAALLETSARSLNSIPPHDGHHQVPLIGRPPSRSGTITSMQVPHRVSNASGMQRRPSNASSSQLQGLGMGRASTDITGTSFSNLINAGRRPSNFASSLGSHFDKLPQIADSGPSRSASEQFDGALAGRERPGGDPLAIARINSALNRSSQSELSSQSSEETSDSEESAADALETDGSCTVPFTPHWSLSPAAVAIGPPSSSPSGMSATGTENGSSGGRRHSLRPSLTLEAPMLERPHRCMLQPDAPARLAWDLLSVAATLVACVAMPLSRVYFEDDLHPDLRFDLLSILLQVVDVIWFMDVLLNFRTAVTVNGRTITDPWLIAGGYLKSWLVLDVLTAWPLLAVPVSSFADVLSVLKLVRLVRAWQTLSRVQKELKYLVFLPVKLCLGLCLNVAFLACIWRLIVDAEGREELETLWYQKFTKDAYFVMMTITTVGYGDVVPQSVRGRAYAICLMIAPPIFNGCVILLVQHLAKGLLNDEEHRQVAEACRFMRRHKVHVTLQRRVEHSLRSRIHEDRKVCCMPSLLRLITPNLQRELTLELLSSTLLCFPLFTGVPSAFIAEIAEAHTWVQCNGGDLVVEAGQVEQELVFVVSGRLVLFISSADQKVALATCNSSSSLSSALGVQILDADGRLLDKEISLGSGAWFGEACLFLKHSVRVGTVFAHTDSELAVLHVRNFRKILKTYPSLEKRHETIGKMIKKGAWKVSDLAFQAKRSHRHEHRQGSWLLERLRRLRRLLHRPTVKVSDADSFTKLG